MIDLEPSTKRACCRIDICGKRIVVDDSSHLRSPVLPSLRKRFCETFVKTRVFCKILRISEVDEKVSRRKC